MSSGTSSRRSSFVVATPATSGGGGGGGGGGSRPRYAPDDPTLPKPWKALVDGSTGYLYYWNQDTNVTQYERPEPDLPPPPPLLPPPPPNPPPKSLAASATHARSSTSSAAATRSSDRDHDRRRGSHPQGVDDDTDEDHYRSSRAHQDGSGRGNNNHAHELNAKDSREARMPSSKGHGSAEVVGASSAESYRQHHEIYVKGDNVPVPFTTFESTGFPSEILKEVHHAGFSFPTPIQAQAWPVALQSRDIVAIAKTGSGKTLGYLIPGFIHLKNLRNNNKVGPTVLVLAPTRELATQILDEAVKFGRSSRISSTCLYGGAPKGPQLRDLERGVDVVVATPGRLNDILEMRRISLRQVSYLVLDEADRMLDMGFEPQIRKIVKEIPHRRQTLMFTATWPKEVRKIAADLLVNPVQVNIGSMDELVANSAITQYVEVITPIEKQRRLEQILRSQDPGSKVIIFCSTKRMCDQLARTLARQFGASAIHGDKSQAERDRVLGQFRSGRSPILVATDVAARGLDIKDIRVVINYDFPTGVEDYVHRIGRTGRAGATGVSYTFFCEQDSKYASDLVKILSGANQRVPRELRDMVSRGGFGGKSRRWGSRADTRDGGRSRGRNDSSYSGRAGHDLPPLSSRSDNKYGDHGANDHDLSRDRYDHGYSANHKVDVHGHGSRGRGHSRSRSRSHSRSRSRSHSRNRRRYSVSPKRGHTEQRHMHRSRSRSQNRGRSRSRSRSRSADRGNGYNAGTAQAAHAVSPMPQKHSPQQGSYHEEERTPPNDNLVVTDVKPDDLPNREIKGSGSPYSPMDNEVPPVSRSPGHQHEGLAENGVEKNDPELSAPSSPALRRARNGEEEEEGMIPADEDDGLAHQDEGNSHKNMSAVSVPV